MSEQPARRVFKATDPDVIERSEQLKRELRDPLVQAVENARTERERNAAEWELAQHDYVARKVAEAPPITDEKAREIVELLRGVQR